MIGPRPVNYEIRLEIDISVRLQELLIQDDEFTMSDEFPPSA
jgi:hypothetical protein